MKFVLGFLTACFLGVVGMFVFVPEHTHEIINKIHGDPAVEPHTLNGGNEHTHSEIGVPFGTSEPVETNVTPEPTIDDLVTTTEKQMLSWLKTHNYQVEKLEERGLYLISSRERKRTFSEPSGIVITGSGTVVTLHNSTFTKRGSNVKFGQKYVSDIREDGISITASVTEEPDENGYWWIETTRSFFWDSAQNNIEQVMSQAAALRSVGIVITEGRSGYVR